jgi:hypothetical protein
MESHQLQRSFSPVHVHGQSSKLPFRLHLGLSTWPGIYLLFDNTQNHVDIFDGPHLIDFHLECIYILYLIK